MELARLPRRGGIEKGESWSKLSPLDVNRLARLARSSLRRDF
jgi:hypothetical protein